MWKLAVALAIAVVLPACGSDNQTRRTSTTSAPTTVPPTTTPAQRLPPPCTTANLDVSGQQGQAAMGHAGVAILFRNRGSSHCRLSGYPGVAALDGSGNQVAQARRTARGYLGGLPEDNQTSPVVDLGPGETASALVEGTSNPVEPAASCTTYAALLVTPPGETQSVRVAAQLAGCSGLEVHPVVPGTTGRAGQ